MNINATLFGQMITFMVFVFITMRYVWPNIMQALIDREQEIQSGLQAAEQSKLALHQASEETDLMLKKAKQEVHALLGKAKTQGQEIVEQAKDLATVESQQILKSAQAQIEQKSMQARNDLQKEFSSLVVAALRKILGSEISIKDHQQVLAQVLKEKN
jgi:F-type H+-transporting ATPase subunit b